MPFHKQSLWLLLAYYYKYTGLLREISLIMISFLLSLSPQDHEVAASLATTLFVSVASISIMLRNSYQLNGKLHFLRGGHAASWWLQMRGGSSAHTAS